MNHTVELSSNELQTLQSILTKAGLPRQIKEPCNIFQDILGEQNAAIGMLDETIMLVRHDGTKAWGVAVLPTRLEDECSVVLLDYDSSEIVEEYLHITYSSAHSLSRILHTLQSAYVIRKPTERYNAERVFHMYGCYMTNAVQSLVRTYFVGGI